MRGMNTLASRIAGGPQIAFDKPDGVSEGDLKKLAEDLKKATDEVKSFAEKVQTEMKNLGDASGETKTNADKALTEMNTISQRITDLEQKAARRGGATLDDEPKTLGQVFIEDEDVKKFLGGTKRGQVHKKVETKTVISLTGASATVGSGVSPGTSLVPAQRVGIALLPQRRFTVRDLITPGQTNSSNIEFAQQQTFQNLAATVAEAGAKPQSDATFDLKNAPVRTIAHYIKASRQILDDAPQLQSVIDGLLRYGLALVEEAQLLAGDGTGQNISGIMTQATAYSQPSGSGTITGETAIDRIRLALLQSTLALYPASGIVLNPTDWTVIELLKDSMGRYIIGDPQGQIGKRLWSLPVVDTPAMTVNNFLVGAFQLGAQIFDRMEAEVMISTEDQDNFVKNMVTIRGEERLALAVYAPLAFVTGTLP